jgi:hypothetical protein
MGQNEIRFANFGDQIFQDAQAGAEAHRSEAFTVCNETSVFD